MHAVPVIFLQRKVKNTINLKPVDPYVKEQTEEPVEDGEEQPELPWVSATGSYRFATVVADVPICSQIGT